LLRAGAPNRRQSNRGAGNGGKNAAPGRHDNPPGIF
jgi:hypothetical protein